MSRAPAVEKRWYETALGQFALHSGSFEKMSGHVEVDETFIGGQSPQYGDGRFRPLQTGNVADKRLTWNQLIGKNADGETP